MTTCDDRIDEAARELTAGRPRTGFATRIVARLDQPPYRWPRAWLLAPAAVVAIVVTAIVPPRDEIREAASTSEVPAAATDVQSPTDPNPPAPILPSRPELAIAGEVPAAHVDVPADLEPELAIAPIVLAAVTVSATVVDALVEPPPIAVEGLALSALETFETGHD